MPTLGASWGSPKDREAGATGWLAGMAGGADRVGGGTKSEMGDSQDTCAFFPRPSCALEHSIPKCFDACSTMSFSFYPSSLGPGLGMFSRDKWAGAENFPTEFSKGIWNLRGQSQLWKEKSTTTEDFPFPHMGQAFLTWTKVLKIVPHGEPGNVKGGTHAQNHILWKQTNAGKRESTRVQWTHTRRTHRIWVRQTVLVPLSMPCRPCSTSLHHLNES